MRNDSKLTLGLVGCGWVTEVRHLPALRAQPGVEVTALADVDESRLNIVADKFRIGRRHVGYRSLILDSTVDAVGICVPTPYHAEVAEAALEAGKHIFIEKPLALTLEQCDRLIERASMFPHLNVMVGFNLRWHCLVRRARHLLRQGKIGIVELVRSALASDYEAVSDWRKRRETGGGSLLEQGVHHIDLWRFLLDSDVDEVYAVSRSKNWDDETATLTARMSNGVLSSAVFSQRTSEINEVEIYGNGGRLNLSCYRFDGLEVFPISNAPGDMGTRIRSMTHAIKELPRGLLKTKEGGYYIASYRAEWRHFIDAIKRDAPVECTLEDGRRSLQVALAAIDSIRTRQPVKIEQ